MKSAKKWFWQQDWDRLVQEVCALLIGLGIGLYAYESKVALLPMKWQMDKQVVSSLEKKTPSQKSSNFGFFTDSPLVKNFWKQSGAERYLSNLGQYTAAMEKLGVKGSLRDDLESLMTEGVSPIPEKWKSPENRPFLIFGLLLIIICFSLKIAIYSGKLHLNRLKLRLLKGGKSPPKGKNLTDWNGIIQEIATLGLSIIGGVYILPGLEAILQGEQASFPYPFLGFLTFATCIFLKSLIYSNFLDLNVWKQEGQKGKKGQLFSWRRFRQFSKEHNWNKLAQEVTTIIIGVALGIYAYDSKLALVPLKWSMDKQVGKQVEQTQPTEKPSFWDNIWQNTPKGVKNFWNEQGADRYLQNLDKYTQVFNDMSIEGGLKNKLDSLMRSGVDTVPDSWKKKENLPYLMALLAAFLASILLKISLYFSWIDLNRVFQKEKKLRNLRPRANWNELFHETSSILLSAMTGIYTDPFFDTLAGQEASFPYPLVGPILILVCILLKIGLYSGLFNLGRSQDPKSLNKGKKRTQAFTKPSRSDSVGKRKSGFPDPTLRPKYTPPKKKTRTKAKKTVRKPEGGGKSWSLLYQQIAQKFSSGKKAKSKNRKKHKK